MGRASYSPRKPITGFPVPWLQLTTKAVGISATPRSTSNPAPCKVSAPLLPEIGINLFNMGFDIHLNELKELTQNKVTLLGNIPPRDVLASGDRAKVVETANQLLNSLQDRSKVIFSCGGGMPPGVSSENINAFMQTIQQSSQK